MSLFSLHRMGSLGRSAVKWGLLFVALVLVWKAIFLLEPCVGRPNAQPDFNRSDLAWCGGSLFDRLSVPGPPFLAHYLSLILLTLLIVGLWHAGIAAWRWWCASQMRQWIAGRSGRVVFALRYALILALCIVANWLVPIIQPCASDFFFSPASGFHCQLFEDRLLPVPLSLVPTGPPLLVAALFIVIVWYVLEARYLSRS